MIKTIRSLGYRKLKEEVWAKPVGFSLFLINLESKEWFNYFKGKDGKMHVYNSEYLGSYCEDDTLLSNLKAIESYTRNNIGDWDNDFQFLTSVEIGELILEGDD